MEIGFLSASAISKPAHNAMAKEGDDNELAYLLHGTRIGVQRRSKAKAFGLSSGEVSNDEIAYVLQIFPTRGGNIRSKKNFSLSVVQQIFPSSSSLIG